MASAFTLSGLITINFDLTNTATIGSVADTTNVFDRFEFANGTDGGQANAYVRLSGTVAANEIEEYIDLSAITVPTQSGGTYTMGLQKIRMVYARNTSATQFLRVGLVGSSPSPVYWESEIHPGGFVLWSVGDTSTAHGYNNNIAIEQAYVYGHEGDFTPVGYEIILVGVKS